MKAIITVDLGFGDSGKGTIVDALVRRYNAGLIVRFNGGSQAAHSVYNKAGVHHAFSQLGSTFQPNVYTLLSRYMLVNPLILTQEAETLASKGVPDPLSRVFIDERALMVTPFHRAMNRLRELARGGSRHGSCGAGIGECMAHALAHPEDAIRMGDLHNPVKFQQKLGKLCYYFGQQVMGISMNIPDCQEAVKQISTFDYKIEALWKIYERFYYKVRERLLDEQRILDLFSPIGTVVFEAAQGVLLDESYGFHPYTTWSTTTTKNARLILEEAEIMEKPTTVGILRTYMTRHGAGPLPTEDAKFAKAWKLIDENNPHNAWQESMRYGPLDLPLLRYALQVNGAVDYLAVTHLDKVTIKWPICTHYLKGGLLPIPKTLAEQEAIGKGLVDVEPVITQVDKLGFVEEIQEALGTPVGVMSQTPGPDKDFFMLLESKVDS